MKMMFVIHTLVVIVLGDNILDARQIGALPSLIFFFFQAEDGIRDYKVTGVQTCALPIYIRPDLVLADVFMPVRNGYEVCQYVKSDPSLAHIPVILLVGAFDPLDEQEAQREIGRASCRERV